MKVLVACEFSGIVREAFKAEGHMAMSADYEPTEIPGWHFRGDVRAILHHDWDMIIAFPPCTYLARSGASHHARSPEMYDALSFATHFMCAPCDLIAVENPIGAINSHIRKPDQIVQPWQFGHAATKATCLWLKGLPELTPTNKIGPPYVSHVMAMSQSPDRSKNRSRTYTGIAEAMARQWGSLRG